MAYYKRLNLEHVDEIAQEFLSIIPPEHLQESNLRNIDHEAVKGLTLLWEELAKLNLTRDDMLGVHLITVLPEHEFPVHQDGGKAGTALNWPIIGCRGTRTVYYELRKGVAKEDIRYNPSGEYYVYTDDQVEEVDSVEWDNQPIMLSVHDIHRPVKNSSNEFRATVSLRFKHPLDLE